MRIHFVEIQCGPLTTSASHESVRTYRSTNRHPHDSISSASPFQSWTTAGIHGDGSSIESNQQITFVHSNACMLFISITNTNCRMDSHSWHRATLFRNIFYCVLFFSESIVCCASSVFILYAPNFDSYYWRKCFETAILIVRNQKFLF